MNINNFDNIDKNDDNLFEKNESKVRTNSKSFIIYALVLIAVIISVFYFNPYITEEESCVLIMEKWNYIDETENDFIKTNDEIVNIWNNFIDVSFEDEYFYLNHEEQLDIHSEINAYDIKFLNNEQKNILKILSKLEIKEDSFHRNHNQLFILLNSIKIETMNVYNYKIDGVNLSIEYINQIENFYKKWDEAYFNNNQDQLDSLQSNFASYDENWTSQFSQTQNNYDINNEIIITLVNDFEILSTEVCELIFSSQ